MVSVRCWTCWKGRFWDNQPWSRGLEGANRTWSFSRIAAVPMMPEASKVSIEWSRCYCRTSANTSSGVRCGIAYVKRLETGAVLIEGLVVVLDELLWYRDQPRFATGSAPQTGMPAVHGAQRLARYVLPTSSKASHSQSRRTRPKRGRYNIHILMVWGCCSTGETVKGGVWVAGECAGASRRVFWWVVGRCLGTVKGSHALLAFDALRWWGSAKAPAPTLLRPPCLILFLRCPSAVRLTQLIAPLDIATSRFMRRTRRGPLKCAPTRLDVPMVCTSLLYSPSHYDDKTIITSESTMTVWCQTYQAQQADLHSTHSTYCIEPIHTLTRYFADIYALSESASYESVPIRQYIQFRITYFHCCNLSHSNIHERVEHVQRLPS
jgi:hypothetical protein